MFFCFVTLTTFGWLYRKGNYVKSVEKFEESFQTVRNLISQNDFNGLPEFLKQGSVFQENLNK